MGAKTSVLVQPGDRIRICTPGTNNNSKIFLQYNSGNNKNNNNDDDDNHNDATSSNNRNDNSYSNSNGNNEVENSRARRLVITRMLWVIRARLALQGAVVRHCKASKHNLENLVVWPKGLHLLMDYPVVVFLQMGLPFVDQVVFCRCVAS